MRRRILSILVSISMALLLVPAAAFTAVADTAGTAATPSVTAFATKDQLMNSFAPKDPSAIGKLAFGKNSEGKTQEWYILGKDYGISGETGGSDDNVMIFAASPLISSQVFRENLTPSPVPYDKAWGEYNDNKVVTAVAVNHYGASDLRAVLNSIATDTNSSYFTAAEQGMMNSSSILTYEYYNGSPLSYNTTDVLYPIDRFVWYFGIKSYRVGASYTELDTCYALDNGAYYWTRGTENEYSAYAFVVSGSSKTESLAAVHQPYAVRPAGNLDLSDVLFASAAEASDSGAKAGDIASGKAMTLRMNGSESTVGSATYDASKGVIVAGAASGAASSVSLMVQGNDGAKDWYFSTSLSSGDTQVTVPQIKAATGASSVDLSACKIWVEKTGSDGMACAAMAKPASIAATTISSVALTGLTPTAGTQLPATAECSTNGVIVDSVTYTANGAASTGTVAWDTVYTLKVTLKASTLSNARFMFGDSVSVTVDGKSLGAALSPGSDGKITVTCQYTTPRGTVTNVTVPTTPADNVFTSYYGFTGCAASPTSGSELGSTATIVYKTNGNEDKTQALGVSWTIEGVATYDRTPGATNTFRWTVPASSLNGFDATRCPGYDSSTGNITGTVVITNREATPVINRGSNDIDLVALTGSSVKIDLREHFAVDENAGARSYSIESNVNGWSLDGDTLTVTEPGTFTIMLTTAAHEFYTEGDACCSVINAVRPSASVAFTTTFGDGATAAETVTVTNTTGGPATLSSPTSKYFVVSGLPTSSLEAGATATLSVSPKAEVGAGTYSEVIEIPAGNGDAISSFIYMVANLTVQKAAIDPTVTLEGWTYGTAANTPSVAGNPGAGDVSFFCKPQGAADSAYTAGIPSDAGSYTLKAVVPATANYLGGEATCNFTIAKANAAVATAPVAKSSFVDNEAAQPLIYSGVAQELVSAGTASGGTMQYSLDGEQWSYDVPTAKNVGDYTVHYRVLGDANHIDAEGGSVSASIAVAKTALGLSASTTSLSGGGTVELTVNTSMLPAGATYKLDCINDNEVAITAAGQDRYTVTLPNKTAQYTFRAYCSSTANYEGSGSDHVFVDVTYVEPPSAPAAPTTTTISIPIRLTGGGSGGSGSGSSAESGSDVRAEGQFIGTKASITGITYDESAFSGSAIVGKTSLTLDLTGLGTPVTSTQISKPAVTSLVSIVTEPKNNVESVSIAMDGGTIELDRQALASIEGQMGSSVEMSVEQKGAGELSAAQQQALAKYGDMTTCVEASITSGRSSIHSFGGGSVSVSVSFKPAEGTDPGCYKVVYVAEDGSVEYYDAVYSDGRLSFTTSHLSTYAVVYVEPAEATLAAIDALEALPRAGELRAAEAGGALEAAQAALVQVEALDEGQRLLVDGELVANAEAVAARAAELAPVAPAEAALSALPKAEELKTKDAKAAAKAAEAALAQVAGLTEAQQALVDEALVANAQAVVAQAADLVAAADKKAVGKVKNKKLAVKAGKSKSIRFTTKLSAAGTKVVYKKASGSKYITVSKSGKVTAKKAMKKGKTYTAKIKVTCGKATAYVKIVVNAS